MAEVLGVVASGIAVAQGAQVLSQAALSLSRLWREIQDVPDAIRDLVEDLEFTGQVAGEIEAELLRSPLDSLSTVERLAVQRCRQAHKDLNDLVDDLGADIAASRQRKKMLARAKVVLKKDMLERYEKRLQRACRLLECTLKVRMASNLRQQSVATTEITRLLIAQGPMEKTEELVPTTEVFVPTEPGKYKPQLRASSLPRAPERHFVHRRTKVSSRTFMGRLEISEVEERTDDTPATRSTTVRLRVVPPRWLFTSSWDLQLSLASSGWKACFRQYATVPNDAKVFQVVRSGTWETLLGLFADGSASPLSVDKHGDTLLHIAMSTRFEFVEPLLRMGLDFYAENDNSCPAYTNTRAWAVTDGKVHDLLLSHGVYNEMVSGDGGICLWIGWCMMRNARVFEFFVQTFFPNFYGGCRCYRMNLLFIRPGWWFDPKSVARIFRPDGCFRRDDLREPLWLTGETVYYKLLDAYVAARYRIWYYRVVQQLKCPCRPGCTLGFGKHDPCLSTSGPDSGLAIFWRQWCEKRNAIREVVAAMDNNDLSLPRHTKRGRTSFLEAIDVLRRRTSHWEVQGDPSAERRRRYETQASVRDWLEDVQAGGKDLEKYGRAEQAAFARNRAACQARWSLAGTRRAGYRLSGFTVGPRPEDWHLCWEWDADVEGLARGFWASVEEPILAMPGSWVDDDSDSCSSEDTDDSIPVRELDRPACKCSGS